MGEVPPGVLCLRSGASDEPTARIGYDLPGVDGAREEVLALARALATSSLWSTFARAVLVVRLNPQPLLGIAGFFSAAERDRLDMLRSQLRHALPGLRYIGYAQAEQDCMRLAERLRQRFGTAARSEFYYVAMPRGGYVVLGMLAYALDLPPDRLGLPAAPEAPVVIVDDCALSGARFKRFLSGHSSSRVVFAHLYSPPELRAAIEEQEPRVVACVSAHDLEDHARRLLGANHARWQEHLGRARDGEAYWFGHCAKIGFAWSEPTTGWWNGATNQLEPGWNLLPPELCLKHRVATDPKSARIVTQEDGPGPIVPAATVLFADFGDAILLGESLTGSSYALRGVGADMWRALVRFGELERALAWLRDQYAVDEVTLERDLHAFGEDLTARRLLEDRRGQGSPARRE